GQFSAQFFPTLRFVNTPFRLSLNIENQSDVNINDIAFDEAIPAGLVADPSSALTDSGCNGSPAFAAAANYTVSGSHSANTPINCAVDLQFSSASVGSYTWADLNLRHTSTALAPVSGLNPVTISSGLTSSNTLNVIDRPTINMSFAPDNIAPGETTTLTMTIENTSAENIPNFSAVLPIGQPFTRVADNGVNCPAYVVTPNGTNLEIEVNPLSSGATCSLTIELQIDGPVAGPTLSTNTMTASPGDIPPVSANLIVRAASAAQVAVPTLGAWQWLLGAALFGIVVRLRRKK
ncbi:MAG: hypothetical protein OIF35_03765, partial [Cellvibrionaceae bacterium]|nr:hypothetical protein [Cellvibrionaceae bacterium]